MKVRSLIEGFRLARKACAPLVGINSFDPEATMAFIQTKLDEENTPPIVMWDIIKGWRGRNEEGKTAIEAALTAAKLTIEDTQNPIGQLEAAVHFPPDTILFALNSQYHLKPATCNPAYSQAVWNLRDVFKFDGRMLVLLGAQLQLPTELQSDVLILDEKLPDDEEIVKIIQNIFKENEATLPDELTESIDALRGLPAFPAEQAVAMCMSKNDGIDVDGLWERKKQLINDTPGLTVYMGGEKFDALGGLKAIKERFRRFIDGRKPPKVVVWIDEIEKAMAGSDTSVGDTSGTSQDQLGVMLSEMQDNNYDGAILVGVPGAAKSAFAKAFANEANVLLIKFDLGAMKGSLVGQSEERIRQVMKIIYAVAGYGGAFFVATSNDIRAVRPELKRRFKKDIWFFDLPTAEEQEAIWKIKLAEKNGEVEGDWKKVNATDWTGAEIEKCVHNAWEERVTLQEAAKSIIPVAVSGAKDIERLRGEADGKYSSVSYPGTYQIVTSLTKPVKSGNRKVKL